MNQEARPHTGYMFHGGCHSCTNQLHMCPGCCYMEFNNRLPDLNPANIALKEEKKIMIQRALAAARSHWS